MSIWCCCSALSQSEFMWHKEVGNRTFYRTLFPFSPLSPSSMAMSLDCIEKWMKLECLMAFWIGFRRFFFVCLSFSLHFSLSFSLSVFIYLAFCLFLLVALFAGQFQATPQDRPQNGALAPCPATFPFSIFHFPCSSFPIFRTPALDCPIAFDCCCMSKWKYLVVTTLKTIKL